MFFQTLHPPKRSGTTVIEVLVVTLLFMIIMLVTATTLSVCMNVYRESDEKAPLFRRAVEGIEVISRNFRQCRKIYSPDEKTLTAGYTPLPDNPVVFVRWRPEESGDEVIGLQYNKSVHTIEVLTYKPSYDPDRKETQTIDSRKTLIQSAGGFTLRHSIHLYDEFLQFIFIISCEGRTCTGQRKTDIYLRSEVKIPGGYIE